MSEVSKSKPHRSFGASDVLWRWAVSIVLVFATFNPSGHSYVHWLRNSLSGEGLAAAHFFVGLILLAGWVVYGVATKRSLGTLGTVLGAALIGTGIWFLTDIGLITASSTTAIVWLSLIALATLLAVGLSWSHIWRRLSGQLEVDDGDG